MPGNPQIMLYAPLAVIFGYLLYISAKRRRTDRKSDSGTAFIACVFFWQFLVFIGVATGASYLKALPYILLPIIPAAFLFSAAGFYRDKRLNSRRIHMALLIIPAVWAVLVLSTLVKFTGGGFPWPYYLIWAYCLLVYALAAAVIVPAVMRLPAAYRRGSFFHLVFLGIILISEIISIASQSPAAQYVGISLAGLMFYFAHLINSDNSELAIDQSSVIDFLDAAIFILNEDGIIVESNRPAVHWLQSLGRKVENVSFDGLLLVLSNNKRISIKKVDETGEDHIHFTGVSIPQIYTMERREFTMADGVTRGEFITLTDISRNQLLIERLRDMAGVDGLTKTANRYRYQDLLRKLDQNSCYPLAVVIGDVNGLKSVNDTYGHQMGDEYIKAIADVLVECCPDGGYVARYGGDEFATLMTNTSPEGVEKYIEDVGEALQKPWWHESIKPSIALGYAIKHHGNENLNALIAQADQKMYADKMARKAAEREALKNA
jgi:diguanylate cyclase (GGDEF)-like protein